MNSIEQKYLHLGLINAIALVSSDILLERDAGLLLLH